MKNDNSINGQVKGLRKVTRFGFTLLAASLAVTAAHAASTSRSVTVGNSYFGGTASVSFDNEANGPNYRATVAARADGKVLTATVPLASGTSSLEIQSGFSCHAYGSVKLAGVTRATWDKSLSASAEFSTAPFTKTVAGGTARFWVGPVPVAVKAAAKVSTYAKGKVSMSLSPETGLPIVRGAVGPVVDAVATASAGVDIWFAGVDVSGSLTLIGVGLTGDLTYAPQGSANPSVAYNALADVRSTDGAIKLCAWVDPPFVSRKQACKTIYEFGGWRKSYLIASGTL